MLKFICYPKCTTCQKAKKWLDDNGFSYTDRHIVENNPTADEIKELAKQQADQIVKEAQGTAKQEVIEIEQSIVTKRKELEDLEKQIDVYKAKMESLLISQLELLKDMNKD